MTSSSTSPKRKPATPDIDFLTGALSSTWKKFQKNLQNGARTCSEETVHDLRVSIRRVLEVLAIFGKLIPNSRTRKMRKTVKKLLKALGPLRDLHILIAQVKALQPRHPVEFLMRLLESNEAHERKSSEKRLKQVKLKKLNRLVDKIARECGLSRIPQLKPKFPSVIDGFKGYPLRRMQIPRAIFVLLLERTKAAFQRVARRLKQLDADNPDTIHPLRVAFKRYRYIAELLEPLNAGVTREKLQAMQDAQHEMGKIQDMRVFIEFLQSVKTRNKRESALLRQIQTMTRKELNTHAHAFVDSAQRLHEFKVRR